MAYRITDHWEYGILNNMIFFGWPSVACNVSKLFKWNFSFNYAAINSSMHYARWNFVNRCIGVRKIALEKACNMGESCNTIRQQNPLKVAISVTWPNLTCSVIDATAMGLRHEQILEKRSKWSLTCCERRRAANLVRSSCSVAGSVG